MAKRRFSMADEFPTKTEDFLDFVEGAADAQVEGQLDKLNTSDIKYTSASKQTLLLTDINLPRQQPRRYFSSQAMESLITSVKEHGILQPLLVRPLTLKNCYELVAGERRYRAAQALGLKEVPVIVRELTDLDAVQVGLLENLQREDLNPIEETEALLQLLCVSLRSSKEEIISLLNQVAHIKKQNSDITNNVIREQWETIEQVFKIVGKLTPDSFRSNRLPLLNLPGDILEALRHGQIEYTKARLIAQLKEEEQRKTLLQKVLEANLSVTEIREWVRSLKVSPNKDTLAERVKLTYTKINQAKLWENPKKRKSLEKLLKQIEELID
jgi:ParB family chromosome partitioning protein